MRHERALWVAATVATGGAVAAYAYSSFRTWAKRHRPQYLFELSGCIAAWRGEGPGSHPREEEGAALIHHLDIARLLHALRCDSNYKAKDSRHSRDVEHPEFVWIDTVAGLEALCEYLTYCEVITVDTEAHSVYTFHTLICLIQICAGGQAFVIDALVLHDHLKLLKPALEDPTKLKLLHGGRGDVHWLQRLDIFLCNVLDTAELAIEAMNAGMLSKAGLGSVLAKVCHVNSDKGIALADWRVRPLPAEELAYSVLDVLYLQYIARALIRMILDNGANDSAPPPAPKTRRRNKPPQGELKTPDPADIVLSQALTDAPAEPRASDVALAPGHAAQPAPEQSSGGAAPRLADKGQVDVAAPCTAGRAAAGAESNHSGDGGSEGEAGGAPHDGGDGDIEPPTAGAADNGSAAARVSGAASTSRAAAPAERLPTAGEAQVAAAWIRSQKMAVTVYATAGIREIVRGAAATMHHSMEEAHARRARQRGEEPAPREGLLAALVAVCWWRTTIAYAIDVNPCVLLPDAVAQVLAYELPQTARGVYGAMRAWADHRQASRKRAAAAKAEQSDGVNNEGEPHFTSSRRQGARREQRGGGDRGNPFAEPLDTWRPGALMWFASWNLAALLRQVAAGALPAEVECILAGKLVRKRDRGGSKGRGGVKGRGGQRKTRGGARARERRSRGAAGEPSDALDAPDAAAEPLDPVRERVIEKFSAKRPVYSNCRMLARDGSELAACDLKKLQWYVGKGIAEWVEGCGEETAQPTIRLKFEHKQDDQALGTSTFYSEAKENRCVGCGETQHYLKYRCAHCRVVPDCYRKSFPLEMKSHRSHDIVLLCIDCHMLAHTAADRLRRAYAERFDAPLQPRRGSRARGDATAGSGGEDDAPDAHTARRSALVLETKDDLPEGRRRELEMTILRYHRGGDVAPDAELAPGDLEGALLAGLGPTRRKRTLRDMLQQGRPQPTGFTAKGALGAGPGCGEGGGDGGGGHMEHGRLVVEQLAATGGNVAIQELVVAFRRGFLDAVQPRFLPAGWDVDHAAPRAFGTHSIFAADAAEAAAPGSAQP